MKKSIIYTLLGSMLLFQNTCGTLNLEKLKVFEKSINTHIEKVVSRKERILPENYVSPFIGIKEVDKYISKHYHENPFFTKEIVEGVIRKESSFNKFAYNKKSGASGLMQIVQPTWEDFNNKHPFEKYAYDPDLNIKTGIKYLSWIKRYLSKEHPNWEALSMDEKRDNIFASYNWGIGKLEKNDWDLGKAPKETRDYIEHMRDYYN